MRTSSVQVGVGGPVAGAEAGGDGVAVLGLGRAQAETAHLAVRTVHHLHKLTTPGRNRKWSAQTDDTWEEQEVVSAGTREVWMVRETGPSTEKQAVNRETGRQRRNKLSTDTGPVQEKQAVKVLTYLKHNS